MNDVEKIEMLVHLDSKRPGCVLLQAASGLGRVSSSLVSELFDPCDWVLAPETGMAIVPGTREQWRRLAESLRSSRNLKMNTKNPPEIFRYYSVDEVAECVSGITPSTYDELWNALGAAEEAGKAKPLGGDGSDGTTEEPIVSAGEYDSDLVAAWPKLSEAARINIHEAAIAAMNS